MSKRRTCAVAASAFSLAAVAFAPPAAAEDEPTTRELLEKCDNGTDSCVFHPEGDPEYYTDAAHTVGDPVYNCTDGLQRFGVEWSDTTSQSNSVGMEMTTSAGFGKVFSISYTETYKHTWEESHTESQTTNVDTKPGEVGWVERAPQMQKVKGTYELHFEDKFHGHYIWYVPMEVTGPAPDSSTAVSQHVRPMTDEEKGHCP